MMQTEIDINVSYSSDITKWFLLWCANCFRYHFILFLRLVTFAHVLYWVFKAGGLAEVEYKHIICEDDLPVIYLKKNFSF